MTECRSSEMVTHTFHKIFWNKEQYQNCKNTQFCVHIYSLQFANKQKSYSAAGAETSTNNISN
uniref:Uncharacterized protein n=1 Tax=Manihot esculenta TaxID=3983 RepID=A0A2C9VJ06_MANES